MVAAGLAGAAVVATGIDLAAAAPAAAAVAAFTGGRPAGEGGIVLGLPDTAEDGYVVPLAVSADGPVRRIAVIAGDNPQPLVAVFHFTPRSGRAEVATRIRLARSQPVVAVAELADGSFRQVARQVTVVVGGCGS